jgi:hypothetical protein
MHWNKMACVERMQDIAEAMGVKTAHLSVTMRPTRPSRR